MQTWMIPTHNDPLGAVRRVLLTLWEIARLERLLLPQNGSAEHTGPQVITNPELIQSFNPFTPLMPLNAAQLVLELVTEGVPAAAVLRPCELRTLQAMQATRGLEHTNLLIISVDCLGTLPADEFAWRAQRKGSPKGLAQEALQFAPQGGIVPYRYRAACQICESPEATQADINIGVLGLPVRQYLLLKINKEGLASHLQGIEHLSVDPKLSEQHQRIIARLAERGQSTRQRIFDGLVGVLPVNVEALVEPLQGCDDCQACLEACPICTSDYPQRDAAGNYLRKDVMEWLVSCSGCGMCEQACPKHLPLTLIFGHIRDQLAEVQ
jgi:formate dehydrogenase subunit beta